MRRSEPSRAAPEQPPPARWTPPPAPAPPPEAPSPESALRSHEAAVPPPPEPLAAAGGEGGSGGPPLARSRRAGREVAGGGMARGGEARGHRRRSPLARLGAVAALIAVVAAVLLLLHSLLRSGSKAPAAPAVVKVVIPEGHTRAQIAQIAAKAGCAGSYRAASRRSPLLNPVHYGAPPGTRDLEGFLFPATYDEYRGSPAVAGSSPSSWSRSRKTSTRADRRDAHAPAHHALPAADRRLDGRARGAGAGRPREDRRGHLQPPAPGSAARDRRDDLLRARAGERASPTYTRELHRSAAAHRLAVQHAHPRRPAADADLQPGARLDPSGRASRRTSPTCTTCAAPDGCGEHVFSDTLAAFEADAAAYQAAVTQERRAPSGLQGSDAAPGRARLARRAQPLAGDAQRGARRARAWTTGATSGCPSRPSCSPRPCARSAAAGFVGANVTIPHKQRGARAGRPARARPRARSARPTRSTFAADGDDRGREHRRPGLIAALGELAARACARSCSAPAAARARPCGRCARRAPARCRCGTARPSARRRSRASSARARWPRPQPADLLVNCTSVGSRRTRPKLAARRHLEPSASERSMRSTNSD